MRVIGHRGARRIAPENTLESLRIALDDGADGVEFDVQRSADGELVLFHDADLKRLCGCGGSVAGMTWRALRGLPVRVPGLAEQPIAHLDEVIELIETRRGLANAELKVTTGRTGALGLAEALARRLHGVGRERWIISSFHAIALERVAHTAPDLRLGALLEAAPPCDFWPLARLEPVAATPGVVDPIAGFDLHAMPWQKARPAAPEPRRPRGAVARNATFDPRDPPGGPAKPWPDWPLFSLHPDRRLVDPARLAAWRARQWQVWTWTVNEPREWEAVALAGVDGVITDDPGGLRRFVARHLGRT